MAIVGLTGQAVLLRGKRAGGVRQLADQLSITNFQAAWEAMVEGKERIGRRGDRVIGSGGGWLIVLNYEVWVVPIVNNYI